MLLRPLSVVVIFVFALATVALADPSTLSIEPQAKLVLEGDAVEVTVVVNCGNGGGEVPNVAHVTVDVRQGDLFSTSSTPFEFTGGRQVIPVLVLGIFEPGGASASALLECGGLAQGLVLGATIKIS